MRFECITKGLWGRQTRHQRRQHLGFQKQKLFLTKSFLFARDTPKVMALHRPVKNNFITCLLLQFRIGNTKNTSWYAIIVTSFVFVLIFYDHFFSLQLHSHHTRRQEEVDSHYTLNLWRSISAFLLFMCLLWWQMKLNKLMCIAHVVWIIQGLFFTGKSFNWI